MQHYLEGYVRARRTLAEIERCVPGNAALPERPDARALKRWLGQVSTAGRPIATLRRTTAIRSRLSRA